MLTIAPAACITYQDFMYEFLYMGKVSSAKATITRQKIIDAAFETTLEDGFDKATLVQIAQRAGISSSGINAHFERKVDIARELIPMLSAIINDRLNFDSPTTFYSSWVQAIDNGGDFIAAIVACGPVIPKEKGVAALRRKIKGDPDDVADCIYRCLGYAVVNID
ncbi:HTH tetR-type domain-containing protein [Vibrio crassostreae]|uniref:TetR/AcrR family transcriptional regulator n=2 Tax=Vibrio crassostreae TaxID=246167 RepID=UPI000F905F2E|nr:TetR/AcrR family transcriptional regulator [Vibrio crassostreae]ROR22196.1 TetR family transcriptional regulator [Vibrio crassostreae]CAK1696727.1 HTH tetR-type domain-containing protein [Vibrio crassostreae]CAK1700635.1 HTH tetR-type domain-containing protein [Vibrio crassostreae]CAK1718381.1 HTH tetR-type domain-containing protein [Vibrio crassostreae]CAK1719071.1 HTH tetR-type domain-containing protein [Vibrio crassostreae]